MEDIKVYPGFALSSYDKDLWVASVTGANLPKRVKMEELLEAGGVTKYPSAAGWDVPASFRINVPGYISIGKGYTVQPYIFINSGTGQIQLSTTGYVWINAHLTQIKGDNTISGWTLALYNDSGAPYRRAVADTWGIYPSYAADKADLSPIEAPLEKSTQIRGYSFKQDGHERIGFTIENIEQHYPEALEYDDENVISGYDPNALLALLYESNRRLEERVTLLETKTG